MVCSADGRDQGTIEWTWVVPEASSNGPGYHRGRSSYEAGSIERIPLVRHLIDVRGEERICVELADHEMQRKKHQIVVHSEPLFNILDEHH